MVMSVVRIEKEKETLCIGHETEHQHISVSFLYKR